MKLSKLREHIEYLQCVIFNCSDPDIQLENCEFLTVYTLEENNFTPDIKNNTLTIGTFGITENQS